MESDRSPTIPSMQSNVRYRRKATIAPTVAEWPVLQIFSRGYYSLIRVTGGEARQPSPVLKDSSKLTDKEKIARYNEWAPFGASAGTYEVKGNTLITHAIVAKNAGGMTVGATEEATIQRIDGGTFVATPPPGQPNSGRQTTYTRVR